MWSAPLRSQGNGQATAVVAMGLASRIGRLSTAAASADAAAAIIHIACIQVNDDITAWFSGA
jgi:hypothetical protein